MAESFSRQKLRHAPQEGKWTINPVSRKESGRINPVTPAGTSNGLDVQNEWVEKN